jgi:hypothetical protein
MLILVVSCKDHPLLLLKCLYNHGPLIFDVIGGGQQIINKERMTILGRILGIRQDLIDSKKENLQNIISFDDF